MNKKVSVIIPTYNRAPVIKKSVESVLKQTYADMEVIIVDDGSTDDTKHVIREIQDKRIKYINYKTNHGPSYARNEGIRNATAEFIAFNDSDDIWNPLKLEKQMKILENKEIDMVFCQYSINNSKVELVPSNDDILIQTSKNYFDVLLGANRIGTPTAIIKKEKINEVGGFNESLKSWEDWDFFLKIAKKGKIFFLNEPLVEVYPSIDGVNFCSSYVKAKTILNILQQYWDSCEKKSLFNPILQLLMELMDDMSYEEIITCEKVLCSYNLFRNYKEVFKSLKYDIQDWKGSAETYRKEAQDWKGSAETYRKEAQDWKGSAETYRKEAQDWKESAETYRKAVQDWKGSAEIYRKEIERKIKLSVIIPIYNSERYIAQCLESVLNQNLNELEIICVNDGSEDESLAIIQKYAQNDVRIRIIDKKNTGYGDTVNQGINASRGNYVSILESDDFYETDVLETIYQVAIDNDADVVKGNYNLFNDGETDYFKNLQWAVYNKITDSREMPCLFFTAPSIWSAIYKRSFLDYYNIRCLPTRGAAYQDTSFAFKVWVRASRVYLLDKPVINYRIDNSNSSSNISNQCLRIFNECAEMESYLRNINYNKLKAILLKVEFISLHWNADRLTLNNKYKFFLKMHYEFKRLWNESFFDKEYFSDDEWRYINDLTFDFISFCKKEIDPNNQICQKTDLLKMLDIIYIYGAGKCANNLYIYLKEHKINVTAFLVTDRNKNVKNIDGIPVIEAKNADPEGIILIATSDRYVKEIECYLNKLFLNNYIRGEEMIEEV